MKKVNIALVSTAIVAIVIAGLAYEIVATQPVRGAVRTCSELFTIANRPGMTDSERLEAASSLCSQRYLKSHTLAVARGEGLVGIPRNINKNFQAWREGSNVWICPTNRIGPVYQFVYETGRWRFDGPVAILRARGEIVRTTELPDPPVE
jgi:hypothetical protein